MNKNGRSLVFYLQNTNDVVVEIGKAAGDTEYFYGDNYSSCLDSDCFGSFWGGASEIDTRTVLSMLINGQYSISKLEKVAIVSRVTYHSGFNVGGPERFLP